MFLLAILEVLIIKIYDMAIEELDKRVKGIRAVTDAKMKYLRDYSKLLNRAFEELKITAEEELDLIYDKIQELDKRMDENGLAN